MVEPLVLTHPSPVVDRDVRYTPAWCTEVLLAERPPPVRSLVLDPAAGDGAILRVARAHGYSIAALEIREEELPGLLTLCDGEAVCADWLREAGPWDWSSIVTNPPYSIGPAFLRACLERDHPYVAALLRLNHLGSASWLPLWREYPPRALVILGSRRPSFSDDGKTDASEYCWAVWDDWPARTVWV